MSSSTQRRLAPSLIHPSSFFNFFSRYSECICFQFAHYYSLLSRIKTKTIKFHLKHSYTIDPSLIRTHAMNLCLCLCAFTAPPLYTGCGRGVSGDAREGRGHKGEFNNRQQKLLYLVVLRTQLVHSYLQLTNLQFAFKYIYEKIRSIL